MEIVSIADLIPQAEKIEVQPGKAIEVNPLTLEQVAKLFWEHQDSFLTLFQTGNSESPNFGPLVVAAPRMVAQIIAYGAGSEDQAAIDSAVKLPATVQLIALANIWRMSVPDPKKFKEALSGLMVELRKVSDTVVTTQPELESNKEKTSRET